MPAVKKMLNGIKTLIARLPEITKDLWQDSLIKYLISVEEPVDCTNLYEILVLNYYQAGKLNIETIIRLGPAGPIKMLIRNPWILTLLWGNRLMRRYGRGRTRRYLESVCITLNSINAGTADTLRQMFFHPDRLIITEDLLPLDIVHAWDSLDTS